MPNNAMRADAPAATTILLFALAHHLSPFHTASKQRIAIILLMVSAAGCRAPVPQAKDAFSAAGSTRIAPPGTYAFTVADPYYASASDRVSQPSGTPPPTSGVDGRSLSTSPNPGIPPVPPYQPAGVAGSMPAASSSTAMGPPPQVGIRGDSMQSPYDSAVGGMVPTDLSQAEPTQFVAPNGATEMGNLPPTGVSSPNAIILPGQLGTYPRGAPPISSTQWQTRQ